VENVKLCYYDNLAGNVPRCKSNRKCTVVYHNEA